MPLPVAEVAPVLTTIFGDRTNRRRTFRIAILSEGFLPPDMPAFRDAAAAATRELLATQPFRRLQDRLLVIRIDCNSRASAQVLRDPPAKPPKDYEIQTPFNVQFVDNGSLLGDRDALRDVLEATVGLPPIDARLVLVNNSATRGRSDGDASWVTIGSKFARTFVHELGHSGFGLGDEYDAPTPDAPARRYSGAEPAAPNLTIGPPKAVVPWQRLFKPANVPRPTTDPDGPCRNNRKPRDGFADAVGLFEGAHHHACGIFRSSLTCTMRKEADDFCVVCEQTIFERLAGTSIDARPPLTLEAADPWTHAVALPPLTGAPNAPDIAAYNTRTGLFAVYFMRDFLAAKPAATARGRTQLDPGFTTAAAFSIGADHFVYLDSLFNDQRLIVKLESGGFVVTRFFERLAGLQRGFSHVVPLQIGPTTALLHYDRITGALELEFFDPITGAFRTVASTAAGSMQPWHPLLSSLTSVTIDGLPHVVGIDASARRLFVARLALSFNAQPTSLTDTFDSGTGFVMPLQTHALGYTHHFDPKLLTYSTLDGGANFYDFRTGGAGLDFVGGVMLTPGAMALGDVGLPAFGFTPPTTSDPLDHLWFYNARLSKFMVLRFR